MTPAVLAILLYVLILPRFGVSLGGLFQALINFCYLVERFYRFARQQLVNAVSVTMLARG